MRWFKLLARTTLVLAITLIVICPAEVRANGIRISLKVYQDVYAPLVPVSRNFRTCFQTGEDGSLTVGLCANSDRKPATKQPKRGVNKNSLDVNTGDEDTETPSEQTDQQDEDNPEFRRKPRQKSQDSHLRFRRKEVDPSEEKEFEKMLLPEK